MKTKYILNSLFGLFILTGVWLVTGSSASAATITVGGGCSVVEAVDSTNGDADTGGCTGVGAYGADTINLPAGTTTPDDDLVVTDDLEVVGAGVTSSTFNADDTYSGFMCENPGASLITLSVRDLYITNTGTGGLSPVSAYNCNIDLENVRISGNQEPNGNIKMDILGDDMDATLDINNVYIHDTIGTGISVAVTGDNVTNSVTATINQLSIVRFGTVGQPSGGILMQTGDGGVASTHTIDATIRNATIVGSNTYDTYGIVGQSNVAQSGGSETIDIAVQNSTIVSNGVSGGYPASGLLAAGMAVSGATTNVEVTAQNVLIAGNEASSVVSNCYGGSFGGGGTENVALTSLGNNLSDDDSCDFTEAGDNQNVTDIMSDLLGPASAGGLGESMMIINAESLAVDGGATIAGLTTDMRGEARPAGNAYDIGAFESTYSRAIDEPDDGDDGDDDNTPDGDDDTDGDTDTDTTETVGSSSGSHPGVPNTGLQRIYSSNIWRAIIGVTAAVTAVAIYRYRANKASYVYRLRR
jgi:hypothetical protein